MLLQACHPRPPFQLDHSTNDAPPSFRCSPCFTFLLAPCCFLACCSAAATYFICLPHNPCLALDAFLTRGPSCCSLPSVRLFAARYFDSMSLNAGTLPGQSTSANITVKFVRVRAVRMHTQDCTRTVQVESEQGALRGKQMQRAGTKDSGCMIYSQGGAARP